MPVADELTVEARVAPQDIDQLKPGQEAGLKFSAFNQRVTPELNGNVKEIAADLSLDERSDMCGTAREAGAHDAGLQITGRITALRPRLASPIDSFRGHFCRRTGISMTFLKDSHVTPLTRRSTTPPGAEISKLDPIGALQLKDIAGLVWSANLKARLLDDASRLVDLLGIGLRKLSCPEPQQILQPDSQIPAEATPQQVI